MFEGTKSRKNQIKLIVSIIQTKDRYLQSTFQRLSDIIIIIRLDPTQKTKVRTP